jgi:nucleoside phosphorylase
VLIVAATERELAHVRRFETFACGIGPVEAALSTARALRERAPSAVLHVGIAGARTLPLLTVVLGSEAVYEDLEAAIPVVDRVSPDAALFERVHAALPDAVVTSIGTSAAVGSGRSEIEAMEGFAVLRACEDAGVPAVELRVVSNAIGEPDRTEWLFDEAFDLLGATLDRLDVV